MFPYNVINYCIILMAGAVLSIGMEAFFLIREDDMSVFLSDITVFHWLYLKYINMMEDYLSYLGRQRLAADYILFSYLH